VTAAALDIESGPFRVTVSTFIGKPGRGGDGGVDLGDNGPNFGGSGGGASETSMSSRFDHCTSRTNQASGGNGAAWALA